MSVAAPRRARRIPRPHLRRLRPPGPAALWVCVVVAWANALAWAFLVPSFQGPDEAVHAGYTQYLAETGKVPKLAGVGLYYAPPEDASAAFGGVPFTLDGNPTWSPEHNEELQAALRRPLDRVDEGGAGYAVNNPPLYYALDAIPYRVAYSRPYFDRLFAMRLLSVLLAGVTAAMTFLFLRELLPRSRWAWTVGGLLVAFQPMFGFESGTVNNDTLLWPICAAVFWLLARSFARGLTLRRGVAIGALVAAGMLTKATMYAFLPGVLLGLVLLALRARPERRRRAFGAVGAAGVTAVVPFAAWIGANNTFFDRPVETTTSGFLLEPARDLSVMEFASYLWQFYLPRLPFMADQFPLHEPGFPVWPTYPVWESFFQGFIGRFGWFQYSFPDWAHVLALCIFIPIVLLFIAALVRSRTTLGRRWPEVATYLALLAGVLLLIAAAGYRYRSEHFVSFEQGRYLLPLLPLYAALVVIALRELGRWRAPIASVIVVLAFGHSLFAQLITVDRYYDDAPLPDRTTHERAPDSTIQFDGEGEDEPAPEE